MGKYGYPHSRKEKTMNNKKTLIIHPQDASTEMLKHVYMGKNYTVIQDPMISDDTLRQAIQEHDRIIMLGHGLPNGLIDPTCLHTKRKDRRWYLINETHVPLLKDKETISIWCYSDRFFREHGLKGFHTGMIISEVNEANYILGSCPLSHDDLWKNMVKFSKIVGECVEEDASTMQQYILTHYQGDDAITQFNRKNILVLD
jgi:hypothetical protein